MQKILSIIVFSLLFSQISALSAANYSYSTPNTYNYDSLSNSTSGEEILFIVGGVLSELGTVIVTLPQL